MKRLGRIWPEVISFENLLSAYTKARKGKQSVPSVAEFTLNLEAELLRLQQGLTDFTYQPGEYRLFTIYERKKRQIAAAPFRDRVVHHAIMNVIEPRLGAEKTREVIGLPGTPRACVDAPHGWGKCSLCLEHLTALRDPTDFLTEGNAEPRRALRGGDHRTSSNSLNR